MRLPCLLSVSRGAEAAADLRDGIVAAEFKDTFMIMPGEHVRVVFTPSASGPLMYHCHNLEHEDGGMMGNFHVA